LLLAGKSAQLRSLSLATIVDFSELLFRSHVLTAACQFFMGFLLFPITHPQLS
jgi:hypothetical protein